MIPNKAVLLTVGALGSLTACAGTPSGQTIDPPATTSGGDTGGPVDPGAAAENVDENLARLHALDVFEVGALVVHYPEGSMNCYGPCPGFEAAIEQAKTDAAGRLQKLADTAEAAAAQPHAGSACEKAAIDANIAALKALEIVGVGALIEEQPKNNPSCYNLPCQEDIEAAKAVTCARADKLAAIVEKTKDL
jgi:hypothetical protein